MKTSVCARAKIRDLHNQGYNDKEIGDMIGWSLRTVCDWRRRMKLPGLPMNCRDRVLYEYENGLLDKEIAEKLSTRRIKLTCRQVSAIRRSMGKSPHKRSIPGSKRKKIGDQVRYRCRQLKTDAQIAALYRGMSYA